MDAQTSFTQQIKEELCDYTFNEGEIPSILSAFIRCSGSIVFKSGIEKLVLKTENSKVAKFIYSLMKDVFPDVGVSFTFRRIMQFNKPTQYLININNSVSEVLNMLDIDFLESKIPYDYTNKEDKIRGYLVGIFLCSGSCSDPHSSNYHLEMYTNDEGFSEGILKLIKKIKDVDFGFKMIKRRNNYVVYLKKSDQISDFLAYINANNSCLDFENIRVNRDFANVSNRLINMDTYNYKKTIDNANKQLEQIALIEKWFGIKNISNVKIRELCYLRQENKEATYSDLAVSLSERIGKTVSKSNVNHLFIKIKEMAEEYKRNESK